MMENLPNILPVFPLPGVLLLPRGQLPLHIFEPRYRAMVDDALRGDRMIGMIQPRENGALFDTGCAGRIKSFEETEDGRFYLVLNGVCRFDIKKELEQEKGYRRATPDWTPYIKDLEPTGCLDLDRGKLKDMLAHYFTMHDIDCDWGLVDEAADESLITCLSMVCPFDAGEKQALLEAKCCKERSRLFMTMLEMAVHSGAGPNTAQH